MRIGEYYTIVSTVYARTPDWRLGQTYFNVLTEVRPDLAERVRGTFNDPFYRDDYVGPFMTFISDHWDETS